MSEPSDEIALLDAATDGDASALERLLWAHYDALERHITLKIPPAARKHFGVEDILQTVFAQAFRDIRQFTLRSNTGFFAWLRTIADHRIIDALRKLERGGLHQISAVNWSDSRSVQNLIDLAKSNSESPSDVVAGKEAIQAVQIALASLPDDQQEVVRRNYLEHQSVEEIAALTGHTEAAVRGLIYRGKKRLAEALGRSSRWFTKR